MNNEQKTKYRGQVVYLYAFDLAYDMKDEPVVTLLSLPVQDYSIVPTKRSPKNVFFYRPRMVVLPTEQRQVSGGAVEITGGVKLFNVGAISIQVRVPFCVERLEQLVAYHDISFADGSLESEVRRLAERIRVELEPYCIRPVPQIGPAEDYTVFCLHETPQVFSADSDGLRAEDWLMANRRQVAGLLTQEPDAAYLSEQEAAESTGQYLSYYYSDLVVADWDAALIVDEKENIDDIIHIMELANVQLVELSAYDRILDESLQSAYQDLSRLTMRRRRQVQRRLREIRVDLARLSDEISNITKFFGDWHFARIYEHLSRRFHLEDYRQIIGEKLKMLGGLYEILEKDRINMWMVSLEIAIVVLFVIDVVLLLIGS